MGRRSNRESPRRRSAGRFRRKLTLTCQFSFLSNSKGVVAVSVTNIEVAIVVNETATFEVFGGDFIPGHELYVLWKFDG